MGLNFGQRTASMLGIKINTSKTAVIFLHVTKTGGTTISKTIARNYSRDDIYSIDGAQVDESRKYLIQLPKEEKERFRLILGHGPLGLHESLPQPSVYITMLREPVSRVISEYCFVLQTPHHWLHKEVISQRMDLQDYVTSKKNRTLDNGHVRSLSGVGLSVPFGKCDREMLHQAKVNLENHFAVFGLLERFNESLLLMQSIFDWKIPFHIKHNVTKKRRSDLDISSEVVSTIREQNWLDIELYAYAEKRFEELLNECLSGFAVSPRTFSVLNDFYGWLYPKYRTIRHTGRIALDVLFRKKQEVSGEDN